MKNAKHWLEYTEGARESIQNMRTRLAAGGLTAETASYLIEALDNERAGLCSSLQALLDEHREAGRQEIRDVVTKLLNNAFLGYLGLRNELRRSIEVSKKRRYVIAASQSDFDAVKARYPDDEWVWLRADTPVAASNIFWLAPGWVKDAESRIVVEVALRGDIVLKELL